MRTGVALTLWYLLLGRGTASSLALYLFLTPILALVLAHSWLGEPTSLTEAIGAAIVLGGTIEVNRGGGPSPAHPVVGNSPVR